MSRVLDSEGLKGLDFLIDNAGSQVCEGEKAIGAIAMSELFETNVVAVHNVSAASLPLL